jgi:hypothetical protein
MPLAPAEVVPDSRSGQKPPDMRPDQPARPKRRRALIAAGAVVVAILAVAIVRYSHTSLPTQSFFSFFGKF